MASANVKVSVVMPTYNTGKVLAKTISSVLSSTLADFELLIVDDGSTDAETLSTINNACSRDSRVSAYFNKHLGVSGARDFGVGKARGEYIYCMDHDDLIHPQLFEFCVAICEKYRLDLLTFRWKNIEGNDETRFEVISCDNVSPLHVIDTKSVKMPEFEAALKLLHVDPWSQFVRKRLVMEYPYSKTDYLYHILLLADKADRWGCTELKLYYYNVANQNSMMHSRKVTDADFMAKSYRDLARIYDMYASKGKEMLECVCKVHIEVGIKTCFHLLKRMGGTGWDVFADMVKDFIFHRRIPISILGVKHTLEYVMVILWRKSLGIFMARKNTVEEPTWL